MKNTQELRLTYKYTIENIDSPFWAFAVHDGHHIDHLLSSYIGIHDQQRLREEDPYTAVMAELPFNKFIVSTSRFQLDLNRTKELALYLHPDQAWGLEVWKKALPDELKSDLYQCYDHMYQEIDDMIQQTIADHGYFIVYDIHSYNAKRHGPNEMVDQENNPEINLGTAHIRNKWRELIEQFIHTVQNQQISTHKIDIRENIKFKGGFVSKYINDHYGDKGCVLSIEFRKDFMDEWSGQVYPDRLQQCKQILLGTIETLNKYFSYEKRG